MMWRTTTGHVLSRSQEELSPLCLFTSLLWKVFEQNKATTVLWWRACEGRSHTPWQQQARLHHHFLQQLQCSGQHTLVLFLAAGGRQCSDEYISMQQNVCFCLQRMLLKISASRESSFVYLLSIFIVVFSFTQWESMLPWKLLTFPSLTYALLLVFFFPAAFPVFPFAHSLLVFPCLLRTALPSQAWSGMKKMSLMTTEREKQCSS